MSKIIKLERDWKSVADYQECLKQAVQKLEEIDTDLMHLAVHLATSGKWKEWSDSIPEGEVFEFTEEMLKDTEDDNVNSILALIDEVIKTKKELKI